MLDLDELERWTQKIATAPEPDWQEAGRIVSALIQRLREAEATIARMDIEVADHIEWGLQKNSEREHAEARIAQLKRELLNQQQLAANWQDEKAQLERVREAAQRERDCHAERTGRGDYVCRHA